jgi:hypothetical protein
MALASTVWPDEPVPDGVKAWLSGFFSTSDMNVPDGPEKVASFFTDEAFLCTSGGTAIGRAGPSLSLRFQFPKRKAILVWFLRIVLVFS